MPNFILNSVNNFGNTAGMLSGNFANRPSATSLPEGTIYVSIDTGAMYSATGGVWVLVSGGGGGGTNPTSQLIPVNVGGSFVDSNITNYVDNVLYSSIGGTGKGFAINFAGSYILGDFSFTQNYTRFTIDDVNQNIKTSNNLGDCGLLLNFANNNYSLGDFNNTLNGTQLIVDDFNESILTYGSQQKGLALLFPINKYLFGDTSDLNNGINLIVDDANYQIYFQQPAGPEGILINFSTGDYKFGDFNANNNGNVFLIENGTNTFRTVSGGSDVGLYFNIGANSIFKFGDYNTIYNGTSFIILDNEEKIRTENKGARKGLFLDFNKNEFNLGDFTYQNNGNFLQIDDNNKLIVLYQDNVINGIAIDNTQWNFGNLVNGCRLNIENAYAQLIGSANNTFFKLEDGAEYLELSPNLLTTSAGSNSNQHIKIFVNGVPYRIQLKNA